MMNCNPTSWLQLAALTVLAGCGCACNNENETIAPPDPPATPDFAITVSAVTARSASVGIRPADPNCIYFFDVISDEALTERYDGDVEAAFRSGLQRYIDYYADRLTPEQVLEGISSTGDDSYDYYGIGDATTYHVLAAGITTTEIGTTTAVNHLAFTTSPLSDIPFGFSEIASTDMTVSATIEGPDATLPYTCVLMRADEFRESGLTAEACIDRITQQLIATATGVGVALPDAVEAVSLRGTAAFTQNKLSPDVDYLLLVAGIDDHAYVSSNAVIQPLRTAEPRQVDMSFEFEISDLSPTGATITYIPSIKNERYLYNLVEASSIEGLTDEEIIAASIEEAGIYIGFYTTYDDYRNEMAPYLTPNTTYVALAFGYISYVTSPLCISEPFTTPGEQFEQDFSACTASYFGNRHDPSRDSWQLQLQVPDGSFTVTLDCHTAAPGSSSAGLPAGTYTFEQTLPAGQPALLASRCYLTQKNGTKLHFTSGRITVTSGSIVADLRTETGYHVAGTFSGTPATTDYTAAYPALGTICDMAATPYSGGNWYFSFYDTTSRDGYRITLDLYIDPADFTKEEWPTGEFPVVASGLGICANDYTALEYKARKISFIDEGTLTVTRTGDDYTFAFKGSCPATPIDFSYTVAKSDPTGLSATAAKSTPTEAARTTSATAEPMRPVSPMLREAPHRKGRRIIADGMATRHFDL